MNGLVKILVVLVFTTALALAADNSPAEAIHAAADVPLKTDPVSEFWKTARPSYLEKDIQGKDVPGFHTEVRIRWTKDNLYFLFICPYDQLNLKPSPDTKHETNQLWNWDVAEVFIGADFSDIKRYREFEVSPQGEWIDLDVDLHKPHHEDGWTWNSGFEVSARIDEPAKVWYAAMRIPWSSIDTHPVKAGSKFRMNLFMSEGPEANHHEVTWQPSMSKTFHVPERFELIKLVSDKR